MTDAAINPGVRLDVWLWAARFFRTRSLARQALDNGKVDVDGQRAKPARLVRIGDQLKIVRGEESFEIEVQGLADTRGPASVAQRLYAENETSRARREAERAHLDLEGFLAAKDLQAIPDTHLSRGLRALAINIHLAVVDRLPGEAAGAEETRGP